ncbi:MAG: PAS domain S-box protein [Xanthomonadales bacterium]|nr:PAS domain S-box protein [Xanthomonadales bacterium]
MVDTAYDAFISIDSAGLIIDWNHAAERMFGWTRSETIGKGFPTSLFRRGNEAAHEQVCAVAQTR